MFRCETCRKTVAAGTKARHVVVETRERTYPRRIHANVVRRPEPGGKSRPYKVDDPGGSGREAVREIVVCPECAGR